MKKQQKLLNKIRRTAMFVLILGFVVFWGWNVVSSITFFWDFSTYMKKEVKKEKNSYKPKYIRGIHLTCWTAGSKKLRSSINKLLEKTELNTVVIAIKEYTGEVYIPGFKGAKEYKTYVRAMEDIEDYLRYLHSNGLYSIARIVVFKDNKMAEAKPEWYVKSSSGGIWLDNGGNMWMDPFLKEVWDYNIDIAARAADIGFKEIQFDYIRFPSDGKTRTCVYSQKLSSDTASFALTGFLKRANERLKPKGVNISIDVFGLTTTSDGDMGIGQKISEMAQYVDYISPMVYPSHYYSGEYGIDNPNSEPYLTVFYAMNGAKNRIPVSKLRPFLQDFSLGYPYGAKEVRDQIQAAYDNGIGDWLLWNPRSRYTEKALKSRNYANVIETSSEIPKYKKKGSVELAVSTTSAKPK